MIVIKLIIKQIIELFYNIVMAIRSLFWKRRNDIVLFGAWFGNKYGDNPRYLYQYLSENKENLGLKHVVWVTNRGDVVAFLSKNGYEAYLMNSKESIYYHKHAGYHMICEACNDLFAHNGDILGQYSYGAKRVNLSHGAGPLKNVDYSIIVNNPNAPLASKIKMWLHDHSSFYRLFAEENGGWTNCYYLCSSRLQAYYFDLFNRIDKKYYIESNLPRNCVLNLKSDAEIETINTIKKYKHKVYYLPTFREKGSSFDFRNVYREICKYLNEDILWIQKAHSADSIGKTKQQEIVGFLELDASFDANIILGMSDVLITDYSSVAVDALYHEIPVIYYIPDINEYSKSDRGFCCDLNERLFGPKAYDIKQLSELLDSVLENPKAYLTDRYMEEKSKWWENQDNLEEIWQKITKQIKEGKKI